MLLTAFKRGRLLTLLLFIVTIAPLSAVEIVAHRGSSDDAPENTLAAFQMAWERQADAVELDVHLTRDGEIVALHDRNTKRTTGVSRSVDRTDFKDLRELDAGGWKDPRYAGERIPTLEEVLATGGERRRFFIEIKSEAGMVPKLREVLRRAELRPEQAVIISFQLETARRAKVELPEHQALWIVSHQRSRVTGRHPKIETVIEQAREAGLDGLDLSSAWPIDAAFVEKVHGAGLGLWVWTVDDPDLARRLSEAGVDGITTNRPGWLRKQLGK